MIANWRIFLVANVMEDQTVAIDDKGLTVLVEPDNPVVELVSLLL
jgi:hypothetical protein